MRLPWVVHDRLVPRRELKAANVFPPIVLVVS
jgi:hypothetical protein